MSHRGAPYFVPVIPLIIETPVEAESRSHDSVRPVPNATAKGLPADGTTAPVWRDPQLVEQRIVALKADVGARTKRHEDRSRRWDYVASWGGLVVALAAALSAASLLADRSPVAVGMSLATAVAAAVNAAFDPQRKATGHQEAARGYRHCDRSLTRLATTTSQCVQTKDASEIPAISEQVSTIEDTIDSIADDAPRVGLFF
jgi:hypothetical protein